MSSYVSFIVNLRRVRVARVALASCALALVAACGASQDRAPAEQSDDTTPTATATPVVVADDTQDPLVPVIAAGVFAGEDHGCAALPAGGLLCWGRNGEGQAGDGTGDDRDVATEVLGVKTLLTSGDGGQRHTCAVSSGGGLWCWGDNDDGQLGVEEPDRALEPMSIATSGVIAVGTGEDHSCFVTAAGAVLCFGENEDGQLGDGTGDDRKTPALVEGLASGKIAVGGGNHFTCALGSSGTVVCWGDNDDGQLGNGTVDDSRTPVAVLGLTGATRLAVGERHACAITAAATVVCWGDNDDGQLGDATETDRYEPVAVGGVAGAVALAAGDDFTCAVTGAGVALCWGDNGDGQLGDGTFDDRSTAAPVMDLANITTMATGDDHACAIDVGGLVSCWGDNDHGQLGDGTDDDRPTPAAIAAP